MEVLPAASATVTVTLVVPFATTVPATGTCVMTSEPAAVTLSVATTCVVKSGRTASHVALAETVCEVGQVVTIGAVVSTAVKLVVHAAVLPAASATVTVTDTVPRP